MLFQKIGRGKHITKIKEKKNQCSCQTKRKKASGINDGEKEIRNVKQMTTK